MEMVNLHGQEMACICEKYNNGRNALLVGTGGYYCCASVNLPEEDMLPNEIAINNDGLDARCDQCDNAEVNSER